MTTMTNVEGARAQAKRQIEAAMQVLATLDDPGRIFDLIEAWMKTPEITVAFSDRLEPLNFLVGYARRDLSSFEKLFWNVIIPLMIDRDMLEKAVKAKAQRRKYQRSYMRQRRQEEKQRAAPPVAEEPTSPVDHMAELDALLGAMPDEGESYGDLLHG